MPGDHFHASLWHFEHDCEIRFERGIRFAALRWRGHAHLEAVAEPPGNLGIRCTGDGFDLQAKTKARAYRRHALALDRHARIEHSDAA